MRPPRRWRGVAVGLISVVLLLTAPPPGRAFSVLAHQAVVDQAWQGSLLPALRRRFPNATERELADAKAYAHGGSHLADLGYFPLGSRMFTDLLHYVRTGNFVSRLLAEARTPDEYAFALGALDHYEVDSIGHPQATNRAVAIIYPKLERKYGERVTYADKPSAHLQTEFRFDVLQVARRAEIPGLFEYSIDFMVPRDFLDRVFQENYGLRLNDLFENFDVALGTYRWGFRTLINEATGIAWELYSGDIKSLEPGMTRERFVQKISRADFVHQFGKAFRQPAYLARFIAYFGNLLPSVGPFKRLPYKPLPIEVRQLYADGFNQALVRYRKEVAAVTRGPIHLPNLNLDTGQPSRPGDYAPADKVYAELLRRLAKDHFAHMPRAMGQDMLNHFRNHDAALAFDDSTRDREKTLSALSELESWMQRGGQAPAARPRHRADISDVFDHSEETSR